MIRMVRLQIQTVTKRFSLPQGGLVYAVNDVNLTLHAGAFGALIGASGSGKTTLLRLAAGLESPDLGTVCCKRDAPGDSKPEIAMVFQEASLYPHLDVAGNVALSLKFRRLPSTQIQNRLAETLESCGVEPSLWTRFPHELSGGQQKRVALARALARKPSLLLLDEPLSGLDAVSRQGMKEHLRRLRQSNDCTVLMATHDQEEAFGLGQWIGVLDQGRLLQWSSPREVYDNPASISVASSLGSPSMNLWRGVVEAGHGEELQFRVTGSGAVVNLAGVSFQSSKKLRSRSGRPLVLGVRPERLHLSHGSNADPTDLVFGPLTLQGLEFLGGNEVLEWCWGGERILQRRLPAFQPPGQVSNSWLRVDAQAVHWFEVETGLNLASLGAD